MLSSPRNPPSNTFEPSRSSRFTHQVKLTSSLSNTRLEEGDVLAAVDREHLERGPGLDRRVDVVERPLVGRERAVRMLEPLAAEQDQLVLGEGRVDARERDAVEGEVPGGEPRVLPLVGHRHDVEGVKGAPARVPPVQPGVGRFRLAGVAVEPAGDVVGVELLAPEHPGQRLPEHERLVLGRSRRGSGRRRTRRPRAGAPRRLVEVAPGVAAPAGRAEAQAHGRGLPGLDLEPVPECDLRPGVGAHRLGARDDVVVDAVLRRRASSRRCRRAARRSSRSRRRARQARPRRAARARRGTGAR